MSEAVDFEGLSLARLHELAGEAGIEGFRRMRREELARELAAAGVEPGERPEASSEPPREGGGEGSRRGGRRSRRGRRGGGGRGGEGRREERNEEPSADAERVTGTLDVLPRGSGLIKGEGLPESGVYVSPSQIKRCELRAGDEVSGPIRPPRKGERRPSLTRVELVNGESPDDERGASFEKLTPIEPNRHIPLRPDDGDVLARSFDLVAPLAFGQRILIESRPRSGRTLFLRSLARSIRAGSDDPPEVTVLLVDERPEAVTAWERETEGLTIEAAPADLGAREQSRVAERALARARRNAERGRDVVLIIDSLTRLSTALGDAGAIKPFFGTGRELEEEGAGSVTVIATALTGMPGDQEVIDAVRTTENSVLRLSEELAAAGVHPSLDVSGCSTIGEEAILSADEVAATRALRNELAALEPTAAAERLAVLVGGSASNEELLAGLQGR